MKILYVSQYFPPEMGAPAARVSELAKEWARNETDRITVLTGFAHHPVGVKAKEDRGRLTRRERYAGVDVVRSYVYAAANRGTVRRILSYVSFMISAILIGGIRIRRPDIVVATSPQLLCACAGYVLARFKKAPFVFEVRDLWPESILAVDAMKENFLVRGLKIVAKYLYTHADRIVTVGEGYRQKIHELYGVPLEKMTCIPNGIDAALFSPAPKDNEARRSQGWDRRFVVLYVGTLGMAHGLSTVLEAAKALRHRPEILFAFVGEGAEKESLKASAREHGLTNVQFIDQQPKRRIPDYYAACDVGMVLLRNTPLFQSVLPSKIFEYLAMERPILLGVGGQARALIEESGAGVWIPPQDGRALAWEVARLADDPEQLELMGRRGRAFVVENFNRRDQAIRYRHLLGELVAGGSAST